ncbi:hypothetical protein BGZ65_003142 [Modicella reniformis]|uniref:Uncharacterized protein n=1 Tax=Modicella reniformis TaxID=1440133 RepID=A0A9P6J001_9FUNG|nr:hypothetical protein BGZ65_003142 [Modicella reniformis]
MAYAATSSSASTVTSLQDTEDSNAMTGVKVQDNHPIDECKDLMRRSKAIRDFTDGVDDPVEKPSSSSSSLGFDIINKIVDQPSFLGGVQGATATTGDDSDDVR